MATKTIQTRIKNRVDTFAAWKGTSGLLDGEIALVRVPTGETYTNPVTGKNEPAWDLLMKVGDGTTPFNDLPWLSAKAADVYDWAKVSDAGNVVVKYNNGTEASPNWHTTTLLDIFKDLEAVDTEIAALKNNKLSDISVTIDGTEGVVKTVAKDGTGKIKVTKSLAATADIADEAVTTAKLANKNVTTEKLADEAVTNAKVADDISAGKIVYSGSGANKVTVAAQLEEVTTKVANMLAAFSVDPEEPTINGVVQGITYNKTTGTFAVAYAEVETNDIKDAAVTTAKIADSGVTTNKIADENVTTAKIADGAVTNEKVASGISSDKITVIVDSSSDTLTNRIGEINTKIANINSAIANGVNFLGVTTTDITANSTNPEITIDSKAVEAQKGDIVIYNVTGREFIWDDAKWEELGDATRVGALETLVAGLEDSAATTNKFVTHISKSADGKTFVVNKAQPASTDITHENTTVSAKLGAIDTLIANKSDKDHTHGGIGKDGTLNKADAVVVTDADGKIVASETITTTELDYLNGVTSNIQDQLNNKAASDHGTHVTYGGDGTATTVSRSDHTHSNYNTRIAAVEANYVKFVPNESDSSIGKLYVGKEETTDIIIFDCGGAADF